eukprot:jgi/Chrpa1/15005/Chrysochromulina_OHIO_Genome00022289-RA
MVWAEAQKASAVASARAEAIQREVAQSVAPPPAASLAWDSKRPVPREASDPVRMQTLKLLEARVARARAVLDAAIETRAREHAQAAIEEYFANRIDEVELKRRKEAAYEQASAEQKGALTLETMYSTYAAAAAARVAAEQSLAMALTAEDEAAKKVDEALRAIEENC